MVYAHSSVISSSTFTVSVKSFKIGLEVLIGFYTYFTTVCLVFGLISFTIIGTGTFFAAFSFLSFNLLISASKDFTSSFCVICAGASVGVVYG